MSKLLKKSRTRQKQLIVLNQHSNQVSLRVPVEESLGIFLKEKLVNLHHQQKMKTINSFIHNLYGRHHPISYKKQFNFQQKWQQFSKPTHFQTKYQFVKSENRIMTILNYSLLFFYPIIIWLLSIYRIFQAEELTYLIVGLNLLIQMMDMYFKQNMNQNKQQDQYKSMLKLEYLLRYHWFPISIAVFSIWMIIERQIYNSQIKIQFIFGDLFLTWRCFKRFTEVYSIFKIRIMASKMRNQMQLLQLCGRCFIAVHIFTVILYLVSQFDPLQNWTIGVANFSKGWIYKYVLSMYFGSTTMFTVGYGDITPKNLLQIATILIVQFVGVINLGFIISQMGRILSKMNQGEQVLIKNISDAQKLNINYKLPEQLAFRIRTYILNNQSTNDELNIKQEDNFLSKLNDQIREDINFENHINIIKRSVFFLCHWSKKFQRKIATKLIRNVYSPQQTLSQIYGKEKIYILTRGKIDILLATQVYSQRMANRPLNTLSIQHEKEVHFNVYGYSALISGLNIKLKALARDYSICYHLTKQDMINAITEDQNDFQYFHQIKANIVNSYFKEIWEAPNITNTREHFMPSPYYVLKQDKRKLSAVQVRTEILRRQKRMECYIQTQQCQSDSQISECSIDAKDNFYENKNDIGTILTNRQRTQKYSKSRIEKPYLITSRNYKKRLNKKKQRNSSQRKIQQKDLLISSFQQMKIYNCYFPKFNLTKILQKHNKLNIKKIDYESLKSDLSNKQGKIFDKIPEDIICRLLNTKKIGNQSFS